MYQQVNYITKQPVKIWDEGSGAQNAIEMLANKHYFIVYNDGQPEHLDTKPPLALWLKVISYKIFGINEFSVRFPTILANFLIMLVFILFAVKFLKNPFLTWIIPLLMATTYGYMEYHVARTGDPDTLLMFFITCYMLSYIVLLEKYPISRKRFLVFFSFALICAIYTKGIAGLAPAAGILLFTFLHSNGRKMLLKPELYVAGISVMVIVLMYYIIRNIFDPGYIKAVFKFEINMFGHHPFNYIKHPQTGFYFSYLLNPAFSPYFYFIPAALIPLIFSRNNLNRRLILYSLLGAGIFLLGQSLSVTKNEWYISPIYPFLWLLVATGIYEIIAIVPKLIRLRSLSVIIQILLTGTIIYFSVIQFIIIYKQNLKNNSDPLYELERAGQYLKMIKTRQPEIKDITAYINHYPRQLKFYAKKYHYEDSTNVSIIYDLNAKNLVGQKVMVCNPLLIKQLLTKYNCRLIDSAKYCRLYQIMPAKASDEKKN